MTDTDAFSRGGRRAVLAGASATTRNGVIAGRDPQLERAVAEALRLLEANPLVLKKEPPPPIRAKRPVTSTTSGR